MSTTMNTKPLPTWTPVEIENKLNENNNMLDEWESLIKKYIADPTETLSNEEMQRHYYLVQIIILSSI
jgi:hypothetical protein